MDGDKQGIPPVRHLLTVEGDKQGIPPVRHLLTVDGDKQDIPPVRHLALKVVMLVYYCGRLKTVIASPAYLIFR